MAKYFSTCNAIECFSELIKIAQFYFSVMANSYYANVERFFHWCRHRPKRKRNLSNWTKFNTSVFQPFCCNRTFRKGLHCSWNPVEWSRCLYCYNHTELWLRISSQASSVCSGGTPGSHSRNPEVEKQFYAIKGGVQFKISFMQLVS